MLRDLVTRIGMTHDAGRRIVPQHAGQAFIGLANGRHGYLPTPEQHRLGGYETWIGTNVVQEDASVILTTQLLEMLAELKKP